MKDYLRLYAEQHKRSVGRDREILASLVKVFGSTLLHEITPHRILAWQRDRVQGRWRAHGAPRTKPVSPATVNRELDTLRSLFSRAIEWGSSSSTRARPSSG